MKRIRIDSTQKQLLALKAVSSGARSVLTFEARFSHSEEDHTSRCLRCFDEPCIRFAIEEQDVLRRATQVCPVDAIRFSASSTAPEISNACIGCGLCAMRCPVGAVSLLDDEASVAPLVSSPIDSDGCYEPVEVHEFLERRRSQSSTVRWDLSGMERSLNRLSAVARPLKQGDFYPLVASLFSIAGFPVWQPVQGDTNNRIDLILVDALDSLPVEVKSQTEVAVINVKSIQQALENKIILDQREFLPSINSSSSLVVGYAYPPARSDVTELVDDIYMAFGINIGLISIRALYELAIQHVVSGDPPPRSLLNSLRGPL